MTRQDRIDALVGDHAARLSARLQAYRNQLFPTNARKELRKFTSGEVAALLGVKDAYLRKLHLDGRCPSPEIRPGGRHRLPMSMRGPVELLHAAFVLQQPDRRRHRAAPGKTVSPVEDFRRLGAPGIEVAPKQQPRSEDIAVQQVAAP